jgi:hypothetical protein
MMDVPNNLPFYCTLPFKSFDQPMGVKNCCFAVAFNKSKRLKSFSFNFDGRSCYLGRPQQPGREADAGGASYHRDPSVGLNSSNHSQTIIWTKINQSFA